MKVKLPTGLLKNVILKNSKKFKTSNNPWNKVFIKKDLHPLYLKENKRIYKKLYDLKQLPENVNEEIKVVIGKLFMDGNIIDKNTFLLRSG